MHTHILTSSGSGKKAGHVKIAAKYILTCTIVPGSLWIDEWTRDVLAHYLIFRRRIICVTVLFRV